MIWLRLAKFASSGGPLSQRGSRRLAALAQKWSDLELKDDFSDEFTHWMSGTGDPGFESQMRSERAPRELDRLLVWLQTEPSKDPFVTDDWSTVSVLVYTALDVSGTFTKDELGAATAALPVAGLKTSAQALANLLDGAGDKREEYWKNRIEPYWRTIWPKANELVSPLIADSLARLTISAGGAFPDALRLIRPWLVSLRNADRCVRSLASASRS